MSRYSVILYKDDKMSWLARFSFDWCCDMCGRICQQSIKVIGVEESCVLHNSLQQ